MNTCQWCQKETKNPKFCNLSCQNSHKNGSSYLERIEKYNENPTICFYCQKVLNYDKRNYKFCSKSCSGKHSNEIRSDESREKQRLSVKQTYNDSEFREKTFTPEYREQLALNSKLQGYKRQLNNQKTYRHHYYSLCNFDFNVYAYPEYFDLDLIKTHGWQSKNNPYGATRDHRYSRFQGYKNKINPLIIKHPSNCKILNGFDNRSKSSLCEITIDQLREEILIWETQNNTYPLVQDLIVNNNIFYTNESFEDLYQILLNRN